jgi:hypothetical protein
MMISVIVPTMWKFAPFPDFLLDVLAHPSVKDVVLINNSVAQTPWGHACMTHAKLNMLDFGKNIFVNPAWNAGVMNSQCDWMLIINDDIIFDLRVIDHVLRNMQPHWGAVGETNCTPVTGDIYLEPYVGQAFSGFGQLMFVHRQNWVPIPEDLLVYYGDNWIFDHHILKFNQNRLIRNLLHYTPMSVTSQHCSHLIHPEGLIYKKHCERLGILAPPLGHARTM